MFNCESFDNIIDYPPNEFCRLALIIPVPSSGYFWELFTLGHALVGPRSATTWCDIRMGMNRVTIRLAPIGSDWLRLGWNQTRGGYDCSSQGSILIQK